MQVLLLGKSATLYILYTVGKCRIFSKVSNGSQKHFMEHNRSQHKGRENEREGATADLSDSLRTVVSSSSAGKRQTVYNRGSNLSPKKGLSGESP